ncbi:hypothetical protein N431DRAFT_433160 [Stipitochalara longipes BDJ]|nr:hypothetical protein N431DRAFT_433160 [Stipitochalara longipes BDJ]
MASTSTLITTTRVLTPLIIPPSTADSNPAPTAFADKIRLAASHTPNLPSSLTPITIMSTPSSTPLPQAAGGLSTGAKAGIAIAIALLVVIVVSVCICLHINYRNKRLHPYRNRKDRTFETAYPSQLPHHYIIPPAHQSHFGEGKAPLLRDGSYMDISTGSSMSAASSPNLGGFSPGGMGGYSPGGMERMQYSPGGMETLSPPGQFEYKRPHTSPGNNSYLSPNFLSPTSPNLESKLEKERWRESHSIAGYFETQNQVEAEPRLSTGDRMVAEWRKTEIENARERSRSRSREPHPMADYQMALPPFFPKGFKDINGEDEEEKKRRTLKSEVKKEEGEKLLKPETEVHEMDVGDVERGRGHDR